MAAGSGVIVQYIVGSIICIRHFGLSFQLGVSIGFIAALPVGFILSKILAFDSRQSGNTKREISKYMITILFSWLITTYGATACLYILKNTMGEGNVTLPVINHSFNLFGTLSHFAGMGLSFVFNFFSHRYFTFAQTGLYDRLKKKP